MDFGETDNYLQCNLTLEDEFVLTQIRNKAKACATSAERDQFFWVTVYKLICRERAYKAVMNETGIRVDTNVTLFENEKD